MRKIFFTGLSRFVKSSFFVALLLISSFGIFLAEDVSAETVTSGISCVGPLDAWACDKFTDLTIDGSRVDRVHIDSARFDDSGRITITSPSGQVFTITAVPNEDSSCLHHIDGRDITEYFTEQGTYTVRIEAFNTCRDEVSADGNITVTYSNPLCNRPTSLKCETPGPCEVGPGHCVVRNGAEACEYLHTDQDCLIPVDQCQEGPGTCVVDNGAAKCVFPVSKKQCNADNNECTYDYCKPNADGATAACVMGPNICGGLVPCGRLIDDPKTTSNEKSPCSLCHIALLGSNAMNFLFDLASKLALLALLITALLFVTSAGDPGKRSKAKEMVINIIKGYVIIFLAWFIVDFILSAWGYMNPVQGVWNVVCLLADITRFL